MMLPRPAALTESRCAAGTLSCRHTIRGVNCALAASVSPLYPAALAWFAPIAAPSSVMLFSAARYCLPNFRISRTFRRKNVNVWKLRARFGLSNVVPWIGAFSEKATIKS